MTAGHVLGIARENIFVLIKMGAPIMIVVLAVGAVIALFQALTQTQDRDRRPLHLGLPGHHSDANPTLAAIPIGRWDMPSSLLAAGAS